VKLRLRGPILEESFEAFRACGRGTRECVVFWTGPHGAPDLVDRVVHPEHVSGSGGYALDIDWLKRFWLWLYNERRSVRAQVHTHPGAAFHSSTDDGFPMVQSAGFLSLVIPNYGLGEITLEDAALYELADHGAWRKSDPRAAFEVAS
jgi:hypothetical protein